MRDDWILRKLASRLRTLSSVQRLQVMHLLLQHQASGLELRDIQAKLQSPRAALLRHLRKLQLEELIQMSAAGHYSPNQPVLRDLATFVAGQGTSPSTSDGPPLYPYPTCC